MLPHPSQGLTVTHMSPVTQPRGAWQRVCPPHCHQSVGPDVAVVADRGAGGGVRPWALARPSSRRAACSPACLGTSPPDSLSRASRNKLLPPMSRSASFSADLLVTLCSVLPPFLKKKTKGTAEVTLYKRKLMYLGLRRTKISIQALLLIRCLPLWKWLHFLASVSLSGR